MSSSNDLINKKYEIINDLINEYKKNNLEKKKKLISKTRLDKSIEEILGIQHNFEGFLYCKDILKRIHNNPKKNFEKSEKMYKSNLYHIVFINDGIRLVVSENFIKNITILRTILLEGNGSDKGIKIPIYNKTIKNFKNEIFLYICDLDLEMIIFDETSKNNDSSSKQCSNLKDTLIKCCWFM